MPVGFRLPSQSSNAVVSGNFGGYNAGSSSASPGFGERVGAGPLYPGGPEAKGYLNFLDSNGRLPSHLTVNPNTAGMDALRAQTLQQGTTSPWTQMQLDAQGIQNRGLMDKAQGQYAGGKNRFASAYNRLSMAPSQAMSANMDAKRNILTEGEQRRQSQLMKLPGMELDQLAPQEYNIKNMLSEKQAGDIAAQTEWAEKMKVWSAINQGKAIASSGGK